jgi:hypothetical protein
LKEMREYVGSFSDDRRKRSTASGGVFERVKKILES